MKQKIATNEVASSSLVTSQESVFYFMVKSSTSVCIPAEKEVHEHVACLIFDILFYYVP